MDPNFGLRVPFSYACRLGDYDVTMLYGGLFLDYRPFADGLFVSFGLVEGGWFLGKDRPNEERCLLNEISMGYTWHLTPHWFIEPKLQIRDPSGVFSTENLQVKEAMGDYPMVRFSVLVGWESAAISRQMEDRTEKNGGKGE